MVVSNTMFVAMADCDCDVFVIVFVIVFSACVCRVVRVVSLLARSFAARFLHVLTTTRIPGSAHPALRRENE